ncbi:MAG: TfoX/Sxy family protein [Steroidobacteraceae bacterium]
MSVSSDYLQFVLEQLAGLERVTSRRMFGGVGLYSSGFFFGLLDDDTLYLKVDDSNRADYERRGMIPFRPDAARPEMTMSYFTVPPDVLEDAEQLVAWARRSVRLALTGKHAKRSPQRRQRAR